ncbi:hypothetical protein RUM43_005687 [Polyplax serrata]|uniref:U6 small nuclear RNA (adenine-(43)-N(6))-methyltransferase n=1 Tax=Polyplax serrata TaxID=468196 RepID=A0AAN8S312_POLSC
MLGKDGFHPKNIYKTPPNFKQLAIQYPDFAKYIKQELSGRTSVDYQNPKAVRELTKTLLKKDFNLDVEIDVTRLIPRVPLCLNYILWIDDLLHTFEHSETPKGIDIGTGNACIYSLLAAKRGWEMLATEMDPDNFERAQYNINHNSLQNLVSIKHVGNPDQLLVGVLDEKIQYDFCMCNPPFFDISEKPLNRTQRRPILSTAASDIKTEISTEGGEVLFITKLIEESLKLGDKVKIYTTLVGKKCDFLYLKKELLKVKPKSTAFSQFCQGRTIRWALAWSFLDIPLKSVEGGGLKKNERKKPNPVLTFILPPSKCGSFDSVLEQLKDTLENLEISFKEEKSDCTALSFKAYKNTWSHTRRKKRLQARQKETGKEIEEKCDAEKLDDHEGPLSKRMKLNSDSVSSLDSCPIVEGFILLKQHDTSYALEMTWLSGNKECLHQIFQYFKNYWNVNS